MPLWRAHHACCGAAGLLGFVSYGASLVLFVNGLQHLSTARTGAYFSIVPFIGAALAIALLGEALTWQLMAAGVLMAIGVALHLTERHVHDHAHEPWRMSTSTSMFMTRATCITSMCTCPPLRLVRATHTRICMSH